MGGAAALQLASAPQLASLLNASLNVSAADAREILDSYGCVACRKVSAARLVESVSRNWEAHQRMGFLATLTPEERALVMEREEGRRLLDKEGPGRSEAGSLGAGEARRRVRGTCPSGLKDSGPRR